MKKYLRIFMAVVLAIYITGPCHAGTVTENGVTLTTGSIGKINPVKFWSSVVALNADPGTSTASYNPAGESTNTAGKINSKRYGDSNITVQVNVATLNSTGIDVDIEGIFGTGTVWSHIITLPFAAVTVKDYQFTISEKPWRVRASTQATGTEASGDDITVTLAGEDLQ